MREERCGKRGAIRASCACRIIRFARDIEQCARHRVADRSVAGSAAMGGIRPGGAICPDQRSPPRVRMTIEPGAVVRSSSERAAHRAMRQTRAEPFGKARDRRVAVRSSTSSVMPIFAFREGAGSSIASSITSVFLLARECLADRRRFKAAGCRCGGLSGHDVGGQYDAWRHRFRALDLRHQRAPPTY